MIDVLLGITKILLKSFIIIATLTSFIQCQAHYLYEPLFDCSKKLDNPYGICTHINRKGEMYEYDSRDKDLNMINKVGASFIRTDFDRYVIQNISRHSFDYSMYDSVMASVNEIKKTTLGIITMGYISQYNDDWRDFVFETVHRYKKNYYWEIINEIDIIDRYVPKFKLSNYLVFLKEGYRAVKSANPKAKVLFSGLSSISEKSVNEILTKGSGSYFDIMNIHRYCTSQVEPESYIEYYRRLKVLMDNAGIKKPVWVTETGVSTYRNGGVSEEQQAIWLPRIYLISFACGIDKVFWYKSRSREIDIYDIEHCFGLWHKDYSPKPAYYSYQVLTKMCPSGSTRPHMTKKGDVYMASWKRPDGRNVCALWTSKGEVSYIPDMKKQYIIYDMKGEVITTMQQELIVSPSVVYLVSV